MFRIFAAWATARTYENRKCAKETCANVAHGRDRWCGVRNCAVFLMGN